MGGFPRYAGKPTHQLNIYRELMGKSMKLNNRSIPWRWLGLSGLWFAGMGWLDTSILLKLGVWGAGITWAIATATCRRRPLWVGALTMAAFVWSFLWATWLIPGWLGVAIATIFSLLILGLLWRKGRYQTGLVSGLVAIALFLPLIGTPSSQFLPLLFNGLTLLLVVLLVAGWIILGAWALWRTARSLRRQFSWQQTFAIVALLSMFGLGVGAVANLTVKWIELRTLGN
jgi:hypothetical protein